MKRSEINAAVRRTIAFLQERRFCLPPFAYWTPRDWAGRGHESDEIRNNMLGWDVTDFGLGSFRRNGLVLFTLRNGNPRNPDERKTYCEKIIVSREGQKCPMHFHWDKVEDIINRSGGDLVLQLYGSTPEEELDAESPIEVSLDGVLTRLPAGARVRLKPGESITLVPGLYHAFWAEAGTVLTGEVSAVNDDSSDNRFAEPLGRFPEIEEDEPVLYYLCNEYPPAG
jgi:D-lyxose ketol-isomerase